MCMYVCMYLCMYVCMYVCVYVCECACVYAGMDLSFKFVHCECDFAVGRGRRNEEESDFFI